MDRDEIADKILRAKCLTSIEDLAQVDATVDLDADATGAVLRKMHTTSATESAFIDLTACVARPVRARPCMGANTLLFAPTQQAAE